VENLEMSIVGPGIWRAPSPSPSLSLSLSQKKKKRKANKNNKMKKITKENLSTVPPNVESVFLLCSYT
jgi:hypothetical protein